MYPGAVMTISLPKHPTMLVAGPTPTRCGNSMAAALLLLATAPIDAALMDIATPSSYRPDPANGWAEETLRASEADCSARSADATPAGVEPALERGTCRHG